MNPRALDQIVTPAEVHGQFGSNGFKGMGWAVFKTGQLIGVNNGAPKILIPFFHNFSIIHKSSGGSTLFCFSLPKLSESQNLGHRK